MDFLVAYNELNALYESHDYASYESINLDGFENGSNNALYIVGMPGSGKSTLADELAARYGAKVINLDNAWLGGMSFTPGGDLRDGASWFDREFWKRYPEHRKTFDAACEFVEKHADDPFAAEAFDGGDAEDAYYDDYLRYAIEYPKGHRSERFVIEGVQLIDIDKASMGANPSVVFMTTKSKRVTRNIIKRDKEHGITPKNPKEIHKGNMKWKKEIEKFRKGF